MTTMAGSLNDQLDAAVAEHRQVERARNETRQLLQEQNLRLLQLTKDIHQLRMATKPQ